MLPLKTYELRFVIHATQEPAAGASLKEDLKAYLIGEGIDSFVEGYADELDLASEWPLNADEHYDQFGGWQSPLCIYSYSKEHLTHLKYKILRVFGSKLDAHESSLLTKDWQEGWKDGFKPIYTQIFLIYPPWEDVSKIPPALIPIVIEPGMSFGTGQHATTQLMLSMLEKTYHGTNQTLSQLRVFDVGMGSGILSVAAKKMGFGYVGGCDLDPEAIQAVALNASANHVDLEFFSGGLEQLDLDEVSQREGYHLVFANILAVVLKHIMPQLAQLLYLPQNTPATRRLFLSGLLVEDAFDMTALAHTYGLTCIDQIEQEGWLCMHMIRADP